MSKSIKLKNNIFLNGEICDMDTDSYGTYIKWANGLAMFYSTSYYYKDFHFFQQNGIYRATDEINKTYTPNLFINAPLVFTNVVYAGGDIIWLAEKGYDGSKSRTQNFYLVSPVSRGTMEVNISFLAIGRWK